MAEVVSGTGALCLGELGVDLIRTQAAEGRVALEAAAELVEDGCGEGDLGGAVEVHDGLEGAGLAGLRGCVLAQDELVERWHDVLEAVDVDKLLGHPLMRGLLVFVDALGEVEAGAERLAHKVDDVAGHGGGEHEVLALRQLGVGQVRPDLVNLLGEAVVEQAVGLVHDQGVQVGGLDARVRVGEDVVEAAGRADHYVAALALRLLEHGSLHGAAYGRLHDDAGARRDLLGLDGDLLCQFSGGRDDDGADVVGPGLLVSARLLAELGVSLHDPLDDGDEEAERLAGTCLRLRDATCCQLGICICRLVSLHVSPEQCLVDGPRLHVRHGRKPHLLRDGVDDVRVHQSASGQVGELCDWSILSYALFGLFLCSGNLLPLGAVVEARRRGIGEPGGDLLQRKCRSQGRYSGGSSRDCGGGEGARQCRGTSSQCAKHGACVDVGGRYVGVSRLRYYNTLKNGSEEGPWSQGNVG
jgi:hypothetical protein